MRFTIITPCRNAEKLIEDTAFSVLRQRGLESSQHSLQYIIVDGASTDGTPARLRTVLDQHKANTCIDINIISEPDKGMYDALAKGLAIAEGDIVSYINAGDYYLPFTIDTVADIYKKFPVDWLTGLRGSVNQNGHLTRATLPPRHRRRLTKRGFYGGRGRLGFIQQEVTFWSSKLNQKVDLDELRANRLAGDAYLWSTFAGQNELYTVEAILGGHRTHRGQLSEDRHGYQAEMSKYTADAGLFDYSMAAFDTLTLLLPGTFRRALAGRNLIRWNAPTESWRGPRGGSIYLSSPRV